MRFPSWPQRAPEAPDPPGVTPAWLVRSAKIAANVAMASLVYFLLLFSLDAAGDQATALHLTRAGGWTGDLAFWFPLVIGFLAISFGIPFLGKIIIPIFVSLNWRGQFWPKLWTLGLVLAASFVIVSGTISVQGKAIVEHGRDGAVAVAQIEQQNAGRAALLAAKRDELARMTSDAMTTNEARAARAGVAGWRVYVETARTQNAPQLPQIERAMGSAESADRLRAQIDTLIQQGAGATVTAAVAERVESPHTAGMQGFLDWLVSVRAVLLAVVMDVVCLLMPWIALRLEQKRAVELAAAGAAAPAFDAAHAIADMRSEAPIEAQPMEPTRIVDGETGEEMIRVKGSKPHLRAKKQRGPKVSPDGIKPGAPYPAPMGAGEHGAEAGELEAPVVVAEQDAEVRGDDVRDEGRAEPDESEQFGGVHVPDSTRVESAEEAQSILALFGESDPEPEPPAGVALPNGEGVMVDDDDAEDHNAHVRARERAMEAA